MSIHGYALKGSINPTWQTSDAQLNHLQKGDPTTLKVLSDRESNKNCCSSKKEKFGDKSGSLVFTVLIGSEVASTNRADQDLTAQNVDTF